MCAGTVQNRDRSSGSNQPDLVGPCQLVVKRSIFNIGGGSHQSYGRSKREIGAISRAGDRDGRSVVETGSGGDGYLCKPSSARWIRNASANGVKAPARAGWHA